MARGRTDGIIPMEGEAMARQSFWRRISVGAAGVVLALGGVGCHGGWHGGGHQGHNGHVSKSEYSPKNLGEVPVPKELNKVTMPAYMVETPDIILIDAIRVIPLPPYRV